MLQNQSFIPKSKFLSKHQKFVVLLVFLPRRVSYCLNTITNIQQYHNIVVLLLLSNPSKIKFSCYSRQISSLSQKPATFSHDFQLNNQSNYFNIHYSCSLYFKKNLTHFSFTQRNSNDLVLSSHFLNDQQKHFHFTYTLSFFICKRFSTLSTCSIVLCSSCLQMVLYTSSPFKTSFL